MGLKKIFLSIHRRISMSLYKSNHNSLVGVWINFIPHLSSVLRNCFFLSICNDWAGGVGGGGDTWISTSAAAILNWILVWMILERSIVNIRKLFCTAQYKGNGLSMPYLQLLLYIWLAMSVCRTHICLTSIPLFSKLKKKRRATLLYFICSSHSSSYL